MTTNDGEVSRHHGSGGRVRAATWLIVLALLGALSASSLTAEGSASTPQARRADVGETTEARALDSRRPDVRDQAQPPLPPFVTPLPPGEIASPTEVARDVSPPLRAIPPAPPQARGRDEESEYRPPKEQAAGEDPVVQDAAPADVTPSTITESTSFPGPGDENIAGGVSVAPPDPNSAVGPNHIITITNLSYAIYSKTGATLYGPDTNNTLFEGFPGACGATNDGDGVVAYDRGADRFVMTWMAGTSGSYGAYFQCVAVSRTPDPTGEWYRYAYQYSAFNDYPKLAVWSDGYYITYNMYGRRFFQGAMVCALERSKMLVGASAQQVCKQTGTAYFSMMASDIDGPRLPPAGAPNIVLVPGSNSSYLYAFAFTVNWTTPTSSVLTALPNVSVAPFTWASGGDSVPQPNTSQRLDDMGGFLMHRLAYRNYGDHQAWVVTHAAVANSVTAVRWYELRLDGSGNPVVHQQGTYAPDSVHRWMSSAAMDSAGNIAVGYSASSTSVYPGLRATGRLATDALGSLTQPEVTLQAGLGSQISLGRWGDYSSMDIDPVDDCTFWFTGEYLRQGGSYNWSTRVESLRLPGCADPTFGLSLSATSASVSPGSSTTTTVSTTTVGTPASTLTLGTAALPPGATATFGSASVTAGSSTTLTVAVAPGTPAGFYPVTVSATATAAATAVFGITVPGPPAAPAVPSVRRDGWGSIWVSTTAPSSDGGSPVTGYTFTSSPGAFTCTADAATAGCPITSLTPGTAYTFTARATNTIDSGTASGPSASITAVGRTAFATTATPSSTNVLNVVASAGAPVPAGARLLVYVVADNTSATAPTIKSVTFPNGGRASCSTAYSVLAGATSTAGSGIRSGIVSCAVTSAIPANGGVRVSLSTTVAKAVAMGEYFTGFPSGGTVTTTTAATGSAGPPQSSPTASVPAGRLVVGAIGFEDGALVLAADDDTAGGTWDDAMAVGSGVSGAAGVSVTRQLKWTSSASTQRYGSTTSITGDWAAFILSIT